MGSLDNWLKTAPDHELQSKWDWWRRYGTWHNEAWYRPIEQELLRRAAQRKLSKRKPSEAEDAPQHSSEVNR